MSSFIAFTKKEIMEQIRNYKLFILIAVFCILGMMSPLFAKLMPRIIESMNIEGMTIKIPDPTFLDAYGQFFKNMNQIGLIALVLTFSGVLAGELTKGTLINLLAKGLSRRVVILSKFLSASLIWTVTYCISIAINYGYTFYLFGEHSVNKLFVALFSVWLFGVFIISLIIFSSTLVKGNYGGLILTGIIYISLTLINMFPKVQRYNPYSLNSKSMELINNKFSMGDINNAIIITIVLLIALVIGAIERFKKEQL